MTTIHKYPLDETDTQIIGMPVNAKILCCQTQYGRLCLWAMVDTEVAIVNRTFRIYGTGNSADDYNPSLFKYIDTVQKGSFVWHVFEKI